MNTWDIFDNDLIRILIINTTPTPLRLKPPTSRITAARKGRNIVVSR